MPENDNLNPKPEFLKCITDPSTRADEFITKLSFLQDLWGSDPWIFRGQNHAEWELIPSLFRKWNRHPELGFEYEFRIMDNFVQNANLINMDIASNTLSYVSRVRQVKVLIGDKEEILNLPATVGFVPDNEPGHWLQYDYTHVAFAIAQHYGIPTRLLDFTLDARVAAFFAWDTTDRLHSLNLSPESLGVQLRRIAQLYQESRETATEELHSYLEQFEENEKELPIEMAVWALRQNALNEKTKLIVLNHPYSEIPNLRAQKGVFVVHRGQIELESRNGKNLPSYTSELMKLEPKRDIVKFTLPFSEEADLQDLLLRSGMGYMHLKPSLATVAEVVVRQWDERYGIDAS